MNDVDIIDKLGGVAEVSKKLGYTYQRVFNWKKRGGIPSKVKIDHADIFLANEIKPLPKETNNDKKI